MKTHFLTLLFTLLLVSSCNKEKRYENRIAGEWDLTTFAINNADILSNFGLGQNSDFIIEMEFYSDGNFDTEVTVNEDFGNMVITSLTTYYGTWEIVGDQLKMTHNSDYGLTYPFIDFFEGELEEYAFEEFTIIELDNETLILESLIEGYEVDIEAVK